MTRLRKTMLEELQRRNYSQTTVKAYLHSVEAFAKHFQRPPDQLGPEQIRSYQVYLLKERKMGVRTVGLHTAALRFFFCKTLKRSYPVEEFRTRRGRDNYRLSSPKKKRCDSSTPPATCFTALC